MIALTDEMREAVDNALANKCPCLIATGSAGGEPDIGYKGSMMVFDNQSLAYWERTRRQHAKNLSENPHVVVLFRNAGARLAWRFHGTATVHQSGPIREQVMARVVKPEMEKDPECKGAAVVIRLDRVTNFAGEVLQAREP
ncbi:MAG: pyridoxamine 5'-phosphate oxidase family protein [Candidatus Binatia bacterium]